MPHNIPTPPSGALLVVRAASDPDVALGRLARLIEHEPSLTTALLVVANSAAFQPAKPIRTVKQAAGHLGMRRVRHLAVSHVIRTTLDGVACGGFDADLFWEDSLRRSVSARILAEVAGHPDPSEAFTLGLIQDVGTLLMAVRWPEHGGALQDLTERPGDQRVEGERQLTGTTHPELLAEVGADWGLPEDLLTICSHHHEPEAKLPQRSQQRLLELVRAADILADVVQTQGASGTRERASVALAGLPSREPATVEKLVDRLAEDMHQASREFSIRIGDQPRFDDLMRQANTVLLDINDRFAALLREKEALLEQLQAAIAEKEALARQLQANNALLTRLAATDPLTGLANRRAFTQALEQACQAAKETHEPLAILTLDIDHFKQINDRFGHPAGDAVLCELSSRLSKAVRPSDTIGRIGGEEFAVVLPACDAQGAALVAERLRQSVRSSPMRHGDLAIPVTASFGGVTREGSAISKASDLLVLSDRALYVSKRSGRDRITWAAPAGGGKARPPAQVTRAAG